MRNWKTTILGILSIASALLTGGLDLGVIGASVTSVLTGLGLITAQDAKPSETLPEGVKKSF